MKIILVSIAIFLIFFCLILLTRAIFLFVLNQAYKNYKKLKKISAKTHRPSAKKYNKTEDERRRKRDIPRAHSEVKAERRNQQQSGSYEILVSEEQELSRREMNQTEIVDIVKPIGFWTSMILGQKLTYLIQSAQILNKRDNKGFWVSMIEAKDRAAGRQHGRG
jgi:hypothetical protein